MVAVTERHKDLVAELLSLVNARERETCRSIVAVLLELGYLPRRDKVRGHVLSFRSPTTGQTIAKIGTLPGTDRATSYAIKFYACKAPPPKFVSAVTVAVEESSRQHPCVGCGVCGAAADVRGYRCPLPTGEEFVRCGAYVVKIPDLRREDVADFGGLLREQHEYFLSRIR